MFHELRVFSPELEALFLPVYEAPGDRARREVLADALLERGEVRGEFIALQLDGSVRARKRAAKLLERHRRQFLGRLVDAVVAGTDQWRDGFLVGCHAWLDGATTDQPSWATVERLVLHVGQLAPRELASPHLKSLTRLALAFGTTPRDQRTGPLYEDVLEVVRAQLAAANRQGVLREGAEWAPFD
jgi:uncharacterized protein (TIGR02996 family)